MKNDYFDGWLVANGIKKACDKCDWCGSKVKVINSKELDSSMLVTHVLIDKCDRCDKKWDGIYSATPATLSSCLKCDNNVALEVTESKGCMAMPHMAHLSHQENNLTEKELLDINNEVCLFGRVKCKYCSNLNFRGICSADKIKDYRPIQDRWRRCELYLKNRYQYRLNEH